MWTKLFFFFYIFTFSTFISLFIFWRCADHQRWMMYDKTYIMVDRILIYKNIDNKILVYTIRDNIEWSVTVMPPGFKANIAYDKCRNETSKISTNVTALGISATSMAPSDGERICDLDEILKNVRSNCFFYFGRSLGWFMQSNEIFERFFFWVFDITIYIFFIFF